MTPSASHPHDAIAQLVDGRLGAADRAALEQHLAGCDACRRELEALRWTKAQAMSARDETLPADLAARIRGALDAADAAGTTGDAPNAAPGGSARGRRRLMAGGLLAAAAVVGLMAWGLLRPGMPAIPDAVAGDYRDYAGGAITLAVHTSDVDRIDAYFRRSGIAFRPRVYDLAMMRYTAVGGAVHRVAGQPSALFVYRAEDGRLLLCQMYEGALSDLPLTDDRRVDRGTEFRVYRRGELTLVFWREPDGVICVLAGPGDPQAVIDLAFAKASRP